MPVLFAPYIDGSLQEYSPNNYPGEIACTYRSGVRASRGEWLPNEPFNACLIYKGYERGRSAARFIWRDAEGHTYPMFMSEMDALLQAGRISRLTSKGWSCVTGTWVVMKLGQNYGIKLVQK